jgi:hypothetical protein
MKKIRWILLAVVIAGIFGMFLLASLCPKSSALAGYVLSEDEIRRYESLGRECNTSAINALINHSVAIKNAALAKEWIDVRDSCEKRPARTKDAEGY